MSTVLDQEDRDSPVSSASAKRWDSQAAHELIDRLIGLRSQLLDLQSGFEREISELPSAHQPLARNLLHYVALRRNDIRPLQEELVWWGLSSLGRCESHVLANLNAVLDILTRLSRHKANEEQVEPPIDFPQDKRLVRKRTEDLLGPIPKDRAAHIMVTMPPSAADDYHVVRDLLANGMTCMRINTAHDSPEQWQAMIRNLRRAEKETGNNCRVMMDLAGPKLRTGPIEPGPCVLKWRPQRDLYGRVTTPASIWLYPETDHAAAETTTISPGHDVSIPVQDEQLVSLKNGDMVWLRDARGRNRRLTVVESTQYGVGVESTRTGYVTPGTELYRVEPEDAEKEDSLIGRVGNIAPLEQALLLKVGDKLVVTDDQQLGKFAQYDGQGDLVEPPRIGCTLPSILDDVKAGERILFDDGKIEGIIQEVSSDYLVVEITRSGESGTRLRADKGINLPDSDLRLEALTDKDLKDLEFIVKHADVVAYSFVRRAEDVHRLQCELERLGRPDLGIVLKIENRQACERLPSILFAALRSRAAGVMIARGDLFVEVGYQRLAEMQEEILWMCEAAYMPVIWATQVLEGLAKQGLPSRAEVTDAAMGVRAECVMLNKGPHIVEAVRTLDNILGRMQDHQLKKRPLLRRLRLADDLQPIKEEV